MKLTRNNIVSRQQPYPKTRSRSKQDKRQKIGGHTLLSDKDTSSPPKSNNIISKEITSSCTNSDYTLSDNKRVDETEANSEITPPPNNNQIPVDTHATNRANIVRNKIKVIRKKRAMRLFKRYFDRYKTSMMTKALAKVRAKEQMSLVRYPFTIRGVENVVAAVYEYINPLHKDRISYQEFGNCCQHISEEEEDDPDSRVQMHPPTPFPDEVQQLSGIDTVWHHMYCVAVPTLFKVDETTGDFVRMVLSPGSDDPIWVLRKLTEQARDVGILPSKSRHALEILNILRRRFPPLLESKFIQKGGSSNNNKCGAEVEGENPDRNDLIGETNPSDDINPIPKFEESVSTIDVRAKPLTLEDKMEALGVEWERKRKQGVWNCRIERVVFADRLYSHACQILRHINARAPLVFGKDRAAQLAQQKTKCVLTFSDVVSKVFAGRSPKECLELMIDIVKVTGSSELPGQPAFLRWQDPKTGLNGVPISKQTSVWIDTNNYRRVRILLTGENRPLELHTSPDPTTKTVVKVISQKTQVPSLSSSGCDNRKRPPPVAASDNPERASKSLKSLTAAALRTRNIVADQSLAVSASCQVPLLSAAMKCPSIDLLKDLKEEDTNSSFDVDSRQKNVVVIRALNKNSLRINPNQILCDADYDGGIVLQPSVNFPRGLRRLFQTLNKGHRI